MPNQIEVANLPTARFASALSRYRAGVVVYYNIGNKQYISYTTYKKQMIQKPSNNDSYAVIPPGMEYRPDILSKSVYGTPDLWWKILEANKIKDIFEFKAGLNIRIPANVF